MIRTLIAALTLAVTAARADAWSHQQHILMTRLTAARLLADPATPPPLAAFLRGHLDPADLAPAACERLAVTTVVGDAPDAVAHGLDRWATVPDQVRRTPAGRARIAPFDAVEDQMHNLAAEAFAPGDGRYHDGAVPDLAHDVPNDPADPRFRRGGYLPLRTQQCYANLVNAIQAGDDAATLKWAGYLAHYVQDSTQPHHATADTKSATYLAGHVPGFPAAATRPGNDAVVRLPAGVNPHTDLEYTLFASADEPRATFRRRYWAELSAALSADPPPPMAAAHAVPTGPAGLFRLDLTVLHDSYAGLPLVGRAAAAAYRTGRLDVATFYGFAGDVAGRPTTVADLMADRNAAAVRQLAAVYRAAWAARGRRP